MSAFPGLTLCTLLSLGDHSHVHGPKDPITLAPCPGLSPKLQAHTSNCLPATHPQTCQRPFRVNMSQMKCMTSSFPRPTHTQPGLLPANSGLCFIYNDPYSIWYITGAQTEHVRLLGPTTEKRSHSNSTPNLAVFARPSFPLNHELLKGRAAPPGSPTFSSWVDARWLLVNEFLPKALAFAQIFLQMKQQLLSFLL